MSSSASTITVPKIGALIIGDEILSGKRQDKHLATLIEALKKRGLSLSYAHYLADEPEDITAQLARSFASTDIIFSFGGIGSTPDDFTRQSAASALGVPLALHPDAVAEIVARFGDTAYPTRVLMAEFPVGAVIVPNPFNRIAGFNIGSHYFLPGFPEMAWPMLEWVLDTHYRHLFHLTEIAEEIIIIDGAGESDLMQMMNTTVKNFPHLKLSSLPRFVSPPSPPVRNGRQIEFSLRGAPDDVKRAMHTACEAISALGFDYVRQPKQT
jgi:molybdopterin-biosynthesis enzyme MoeA-like protein